MNVLKGDLAMRIATLCLTAVLMSNTSVAQMLPSAQVKKLTASAKTSSEHMKLAKHYEAIAAKHEVEAKEHEALAEQYKKNDRA